MDSKDIIKLENPDAKFVSKWIAAIHELLRRECNGNGALEMLDLNDRSIKNDKNLDAFERWAQEVDC